MVLLKKQKTQKLQSKTSRDTYINGAKTGEKAWNNKTDRIIKWDFNFDKSFVIMVSLKTKDGYRDLVYTSSDDNGNLYFGLGKYMVAGRWQTISRNLEEDLHKYEPNNEIISVNAFILRGSGKMGKIELLSSQKKETKTVEPKVETIVKKVEDKIKDILRKEQKEKEQKEEEEEKKIETKELVVDPNSFVPRITLEEGNLIYHKLGEPFFEPGVTAVDYEGVPIDVDVIGEVDITKINRYVLTYIATDDNGYTTTKARVVMVYKAGEEVNKKVKKTKSKNIVSSNLKKETEEEEEERMKYEEFLDLTPLDNAEIDAELLYYD